MKAISIRAPWWWMILHGGKDIENRDWRTAHRGPVLIHASKWFAKMEVYEDFQEMKHIMSQRRPEVSLADLRAMGGHIVGVVDIIDCVSESDSPWFFGKYGFVLKNPRTIKPYVAKGALGFFDAALAQSSAGEVASDE